MHGTTETYILLHMKQLTLNLLNDLEPTGETTTSLSPVGSRNCANPTQWQENDLEKKMTATSGRRCLERFGRLSQPGSWAKTFMELLVGTGDWYSTRCRLTWKLKGTKYNRSYFQLAPSTLPTEGIGFGLLLTPSTIDITPDEERKQKRTEYRKSVGRQWTPGSLTEQVFHQLLPTPCTVETDNWEKVDKALEYGQTTLKSRKAGFNIQNNLTNAIRFQTGLLPTPTTQEPESTCEITESGRRKMKDGKDSHSMNLGRMVGMLPTPTAASDVKGGCTRPDPKRQHDTLAHAMHEAVNAPTGSTSQLNPRFVQEMMGFPERWLILPFQNGETKV